MRGVEFDWRNDIEQPTKHEQTHDIGVIAQEVEKQFPEAVSTPKDGYKSVAYSKLVSPIIGAIKALYARLVNVENQQSAQAEIQARQMASIDTRQNESDAKVQALVNENAALKQKNAELEDRLNKIEQTLSPK